MIIWSGLGFLPIVFLMLFGFAFSAEGNGPDKDKALAWSLLLSGLASGGLGWWLRNRPARIMIDKATGREVALRRSHSLFFIPMVYWGVIFLALALYEVLQVFMKKSA